MKVSYIFSGTFMHESDTRAAERYKSLKFGNLTDEETIQLYKNYLDEAGKTGLTSEQANKHIQTMYLLNEGDDAPDGIVYSIEGENVQLHSLFSDDKPTVLNFGSYT